MSLVKQNLYKLYENYESALGPHSSHGQVSSSQTIPSPSPSRPTLKTHGKRVFDDMCSFESKSKRIAGKSQLDLYLEEPKFDFGFYDKLDVLGHWKGQEKRFPAHELMAWDVLAIPITSVALGSAFSIGAHVLTKCRSRILLEKIQALICTRNWLHGFVVVDERKKAKSCEGSNVLTSINEEGDEGENEDFDDVMIDEF
ncbi:Zinc finger BED domain-containing protein DAYSLEEPER [Striga hermonthica]|uniref:Zinc finger BED domain-containing protein DAYSLEEPER n=1 Tax=Striga hermonthica TaxID=68872 RepID=A0A9N7RP59_STRHE|nr:Zinc finger BED domain-containing protein DAYSLEEPER [Striga hermonthica]